MKVILILQKVMKSCLINLEIEIYNLATQENGNYWHRLLDEGISRKIISPTEIDILKNYICKLSDPYASKVPTRKQYKIAWNVRKRLEEDGVIV